MPLNPLAYVAHLRGSGSVLRGRAERAEQLAQQIARLQGELDSIVAQTRIEVSMNWTAEEVDDAMRDAEVEP